MPSNTPANHARGKDPGYNPTLAEESAYGSGYYIVPHLRVLKYKDAAVAAKKEKSITAKKEKLITAEHEESIVTSVTKNEELVAAIAVKNVESITVKKEKPVDTATAYQPTLEEEADKNCIHDIQPHKRLSMERHKTTAKAKADSNVLPHLRRSSGPPAVPNCITSVKTSGLSATAKAKANQNVPPHLRRPSGPPAVPNCVITIKTSGLSGVATSFTPVPDNSSSPTKSADATSPTNSKTTEATEVTVAKSSDWFICKPVTIPAPEGFKGVLKVQGIGASMWATPKARKEATEQTLEDFWHSQLLMENRAKSIINAQMRWVLEGGKVVTPTQSATPNAIRPETTDIVARRMIGSSLGINIAQKTDDRSVEVGAALKARN